MAYNHHSFLILLGYEYKSTYSTTHILTEFKEFHSSKFDVLPLNSKFLFNIGRVSTFRVRIRSTSKNYSKLSEIQFYIIREC